MAQTESALGLVAGKRKTQTRAVPEAPLFAFTALVLGVLDAVLLIGWRQIDPTNVAWFKGDAAVYQAGWEFLRLERWAFSPTWIAHLDYPFGISAAYLDVIPIVAVPLRFFAGILPADFQYLGAYVAVCLTLQAYFGMKLLSCFTADRVLVLVGALFFLNSPILLMRLFGHFSLCSQWLIVAALYYYFRTKGRRGLAAYFVPFMVLTVVAGGITPYLAVMVVLIGLAALLRSHLENDMAAALLLNGRMTASERIDAPDKTSALKWVFETSRLLWGVILVASMAASFVFFGFVTFGASPGLQDVGYGMFSMNLLSPFSPASKFSYFHFFDVFPNQEYEGYNYLGLGVLLLGVFCLARRPRLLAKLWTPALRPLVMATSLLTLLALSIRVTFGQTVLFIVPVPPGLLHLLTIFRSSGRFFWPAYYLLMLGAIVGAASIMRTRWSRRAVIAAAFVVQFLEMVPLRAAVAEQSNVAMSNPLVARDWAAIGQANRHLVILPARQCDSDLTPGGDAAWPWFARLAARNGLTLNSVHAARISAASDALNCSALPRQMAAGNLQSDTAYVLDDALARLVATRGRTHDCRRVDNFNLCLRR